MERNQGPVSVLFREMVAAGHIRPVERMEDLRLPGELTAISTFTTYGTPDLPIRVGVDTDAKLEQRSERNFTAPGDFVGVRFR